jgi:hypothetical protein
VSVEPPPPPGYYSNRHLETIAAALALPVVERELDGLRRKRTALGHGRDKPSLDERLSQLRLRQKQLLDVLITPQTP